MKLVYTAIAFTFCPISGMLNGSNDQDSESQEGALPRVIEFSPGQVYNATAAMQVNVLPPLISESVSVTMVT